MELVDRDLARLAAGQRGIFTTRQARDCCADAALHSGRVTSEALADTVSLVETWPASSRAKAMLSHVDARSESVGESRTRVERVKHADGDPRVLWDEKRREDRLRALGYQVVRITWADLEAGRVAAKVRRALAVAA